MIPEVDQSGRVEDLSTGTAIAFANKNMSAIFISAGSKRQLIKYLRKHSLIPIKDLPAVVFSVILFILISDKKLTSLNIDEEYTGKNAIIEETIGKLFSHMRAKKIPSIRFTRIGKRSPAHRLAWQTHRSKGRYNRVMKISETEVLRLIK